MDGGETWAPAELGDASLGRWAWRSWRFSWDAEPGEYELCCRARDAAGNEQPLAPSWNLGGYEQRGPARRRHGVPLERSRQCCTATAIVVDDLNNAVQRVGVTVTG